MTIHPFFDARTWTITYVVFDEVTKDAIVIDPVLDYDPAASKVWRESVDQVAAFLRERGLTLRAILETHAHADHLSGSQVLKEAFGAPVMIGEHIKDVQAVFKGVFDLDPAFPTDGSQFDRLLVDGERVRFGALEVEVIHTPGHTPACVSYHVGDAVFTGDALFAPDYGVGRCDFPAGDAAKLYQSVHGRLYALPDATRVFYGHDYQPGGRELSVQSTIGEEKAKNIQLRAETSESEFVAFRKARDATLSAPRLLLPSVQINIDAGRLPPKHANGTRYLSIPVRD